EFKYIIIIINRLTKIKYYIPTVNLIVKKLIEYFIKKIYSIYNLPDSIVSNYNTQFIL
ncbi:hypothetical protein NEUTE1DRAFT_52909, partial [Neurospora tetrasperma FGSC 2508]